AVEVIVAVVAVEVIIAGAAGEVVLAVAAIQSGVGGYGAVGFVDRDRVAAVAAVDADAAGNVGDAEFGIGAVDGDNVLRRIAGLERDFDGVGFVGASDDEDAIGTRRR